MTHRDRDIGKHDAMEQPELGKTGDENTTPEAAELSNAETGTASEMQPTSEDMPTEVDNQPIEEPAAEETPEPTAQVAPETEAETEAEVPAEVSAEEASAEEASAEEASAEEEEEAAAESTQPSPNGLRRGDVVRGTVSRTSPTAIHVVVQGADDQPIEGIVPGRELELMSRKMIDDLREGAEVDVFVVNPLNHKGDTVLSINQAQEEIDWREAQDYLESKSVYDGRIGGYNRGGLIVRFGQLRGFVPQSQIADTRLRLMKGDTPEERYGGLVNEEISVKVMEVDRSRNRLILSERAAMREVRQRRKEALVTELQVGEERNGIVVSLENFGAFVDVGGAEGLVHLTELSWQHVTHPRQVLNVGDEVRVRVISVDEDNNRIGLSIRQLLPDPWDEIAAMYPAGALVRGTITKLAKFGAFARIDADTSVEGLIHISELSDNRVEHPREVVKRGDVLALRVVKVDVKNRRLGLSIKKVNSEEYLDQDLERAYIEADRMIAAGALEQVAEPEAAEPEAAEPETAEPETAGEVVEEVVEEVAGAVEEAAEMVEEAITEASETIEETVADVTEAIEETVEDVQAAVEEATEDAEESVSEAVEEAAETTEATIEETEETVEQAVEETVGGEEKAD